MRLKKMTALFLALAALWGYAFAQEEENEEIGLTAGLELGLGDIANRAVFGITPYVVYEHSFDNLDVYGELDYTMEFDNPMFHYLYFEGELGYNLFLGSDRQKLTFILNNQDTIFLAPPGMASAGILEPSVKYTQTLGIGDLYGQIGLPVAYPITYMTGVATGAYLRAGWASTFGLGLEVTGNLGLSPETGYASTGLLVSYERGPFYGEVEFEFGNGFVIVKPEVDLSLIGAWTFVIRAEIEAAGGYTSFRPFIGAQYSF